MTYTERLTLPMNGGRCSLLAILMPARVCARIFHRMSWGDRSPELAWGGGDSYPHRRRGRHRMRMAL